MSQEKKLFYELIIGACKAALEDDEDKKEEIHSGMDFMWYKLPERILVKVRSIFELFNEAEDELEKYKVDVSNLIRDLGGEG